jgi:hypothetical protein
MAVRIILYYDRRCYPGHYIVYQNIIAAELRKAVFGNVQIVA